MNKCVVLIDYENIYYGKDSTKERLSFDFSIILDALWEDTIDYIEIRLYDGWRTEAHSTQKADRVSAITEQVEAELFPVIKNGRKVFGVINLATSQYGFEFEWENTLAIKSGVHRLSINDKIEQCCDNLSCPIQMISKASKGETVSCPIEACESVNFNKLVRREQKMVDAMIASDMLEYILDEEYNTIAIVSDDTDMFPSLLMASKHKKNSQRLVYITKNNWHLKKYKSLFYNNNIKGIFYGNK